MKYTVIVSLDSSALDSLTFEVNSYSYLGATISALVQTDKLKISESDIDSMKISVTPF
jgi:hypothetical protein